MRNRLFGSWMVVVCVAALASGCSNLDPSQRDRMLETVPDPVAEARSMLEGYASGSPMGSEASMYDDLVSRVKAADAAKGESLAEFLDDVRKSPSGLPSRAKKFLETF